MLVCRIPLPTSASLIPKISRGKTLRPVGHWGCPCLTGWQFNRVFRRLRQPFAWLALVAWLAASGLSWDLLQVVAWTKMSVDNATQLTASAAVSKTLEDAPCPLCVAAQEGRKNSEQAPLAKDEISKVKAKADPVAGEIRLLTAKGFSGRDYAHPADEVGVSRVAEVPVPPPRAQV